MHTRSIAELFQLPGPFASVFVDVSQDSESGVHQRELRVEEAAEKLLGDGVSQSVVDEVSTRLNTDVDLPAPVARLVVATDDGVCFEEVVSERVDTTVATWGPLPDVTAWLRVQDSFLPFALVTVDHEGSDIEIYRTSSASPSDTAQVHGETFRIHKVRAGAWGPDHLQNATEQVWRRNAQQTADEIDSLVMSGIRLVVIAGDARARSDLRDAVGNATKASLVEVDAGGRAEGSSRTALESAVVEVLQGHAVDQRVQQVRELQERLGRDSAVATGSKDILAAFVRGQVETLLLDPDRAGESTIDPADHLGLDLGGAGRGPDRPGADRCCCTHRRRRRRPAVGVDVRRSRRGLAALGPMSRANLFGHLSRWVFAGTTTQR